MRRSGVRNWRLGLVLVLSGCDLQQMGEATKPEPAAAPTVLPAPPPPPPPSAPVPPPLEPAPPPPAEPRSPVLGLSAGAALAGLYVNQLRVTPASQQPTKDRFGPTPAPGTAAPRHEVTVYAVFKAPFERRLELRALDDLSAEIGRSERDPIVSAPTDSSRYVTFRFDARLPIERVSTFVVYVDPAPEVPVEAASSKAPPSKSQPRPTKPPAPSPEPQPLHTPRPGLVPKDP